MKIDAKAAYEPVVDNVVVVVVVVVVIIMVIFVVVLRSRWVRRK